MNFLQTQLGFKDEIAFLSKCFYNNFTTFFFVLLSFTKTVHPVRFSSRLSFSLEFKFQTTVFK